LDRNGSPTMGESKVPIYAYVDESGNTGRNIFDNDQPDFFTAAIITKGDFDARHRSSIGKLAQGLGQESLHAKKLGIRRLEEISTDLVRILRAGNAHFFVSRVEKKYLLATKMFDALFDSGENAAVAWHHYNLRPLRILLAFKLAGVVDEETARLFWQCLLEPKEEDAYDLLPDVCRALQSQLHHLPDAKSREVLGEGLTWAAAHPKSIQIHNDRKLAKQGHFPNMVAFANLLDGLEGFSNRWNRRVAQITHDEQSEFEATLAFWHEMFSTASPEPIRWAGETFVFQKVVGSEFEVKEDSQSPGIQVADVVLWLYSQFRKGKELTSGCADLIRYVLEHGWESDFSFAGVERVMLEKYGDVLFGPITAKQEEAARELLGKAEQARLASMAQYTKDQLPPFLRGNTSKTIEG